MVSGIFHTMDYRFTKHDNLSSFLIIKSTKEKYFAFIPKIRVHNIDLLCKKCVRSFV